MNTTTEELERLAWHHLAERGASGHIEPGPDVDVLYVNGRVVATAPNTRGGTAPTLTRIVADAKADAWDEGWAARAEFDERRAVPTDWPDLNPYRAALGGTTDGTICRWCPPGCKSCEPEDCECYTHQDEPDKAFPLGDTTGGTA